jgi:hypothetical protein
MAAFRLPEPEEEPAAPAPARHGSAAPAEALLSAAVELPWDDWLGAGAGDRVRDGSLGLVRHAYPATAARDMGGAATAAGMLRGDAAARERLGAVALRVAAAHHRPARMPHQPGEEPFAWWLAEDRALVWMPWEGAGQAPYGLDLLESGQADAVVVTAADACWTVFRTGLPRRGARGGWADLPERFRSAITERAGAEAAALERARWRREGDVITVRWREGERLRSAAVSVNRPAPPG